MLSAIVNRLHGRSDCQTEPTGQFVLEQVVAPTARIEVLFPPLLVDKSLQKTLGIYCEDT
jgi:hypothetical protein